MIQTESGTKYEIIYKNNHRYVHYFRNGFEFIEEGNKLTEWKKPNKAEEDG